MRDEVLEIAALLFGRRFAASFGGSATKSPSASVNLAFNSRGAGVVSSNHRNVLFSDSFCAPSMMRSAVFLITYAAMLPRTTPAIITRQKENDRFGGGSG